MHNLNLARRYLTAAHGKEGERGRTFTNAALGAIMAALRCSFDGPALGLDLDGTIDEALQFFSIFSHVWPGRVYIVTHRSDHAKAVADATRYGIRFDELILAASYQDKAAIVAAHGIKVFVDDMDEVLTHIPQDVTVLKIRNGGNSQNGMWLYSNRTGKLI